MALSWISGYNNINYLNQMIKSVEDTLSNDYNNLDNIPIIKIISSTSNPQNIWELKEGMYLIDGIVYVDNNTSYEVSNLFVSMTARLENGKYVLSAFIPFFKGLYEYILKSNSTEYEEHQIVILATHERMLTRYNETPYEPNGDYNPATKKYVDDKANEIITELDNIGVNKETITSLKEENRIRDIKLQALLSETSDRNISISEDTRYFDMPLSIDNGIVTINEMIGDTLVNVCDQEESVAITKSYTVENENHIALQGEYDGSCRPVVHGNTLVNHNADWDGNLQTGIETSASGIEDVQVEGIKGQEVSVVIEGNTVLNHALGKISAVVSNVEDNLVDSYFTTYNDKFPQLNEIATLDATNNDLYTRTGRIKLLQHNTNLVYGETYTLIVDVLSLSENARLHWYILFTDNTYQYSGTVNAASAIGKFIKNITISEENKEKTFKRFALYIQDSAKGIATIQNPILLKGDHTTNPKYVNSNNGNYVDLTVANDMSSVVEIEGRTMVNVCDQKDPIAITKSYTVENSGNHVALQGEYDGSCRPVIQGNTMVNLASEVVKGSCSEYHGLAYTSYILKPSTIYTFIIKNHSSEVLSLYTSEGVIEIDGYVVYKDVPANSTEIYTFTTLDNISIDTNVILKASVDMNDVNFELMIFEGDLTQTPELIPTEYVEGLKSSFEDGYIPENVVNIDDIYIYGTSNDTCVYFIYNLEQVLQVGKTYTLSYNIDDTTTCETGVIFRLIYNNNSSTYVEIDEGNLKGRIGKKIRTFTVPDDFDNSLSSKFEFWNRNSDTIISISNISFLEGDWTHLTEEDFNHLGKYKVEYKVTGKNKAIDDLIYDMKHSSGAYVCSKDYGALKGVIPLKKGVYTFSVDNGNYALSNFNDANVFVWKNNSTYRRITFNHTTALRIEIQDDEIGVTWYGAVKSGVISDLVGLHFQIEEGTVATPYEPYKEYTKTFYLNSPLLEGDTIEDVNGVATHVKRYGKIVLDGSENWICDSYSPDAYGYYGAHKQLSKDAKLQGKMYSNNFRCYRENIDTKSNGEKLVSGLIDTYGVILILKANRLQSYNNEGIKQWLSENPTTVVYELASPIYEPISTESILCDSYVNGHLDFDSTVPIEKVIFTMVGLPCKYQITNTPYIIQFESDNIGVATVAFDGITKDIEVHKGLNTVRLSTIETINNYVGFSGIGFNASNIVVTEAIDTDFDYFEGLKSSYECEVTDDGKYKVDVKVTGKNLINEKTLTTGSYSADGTSENDWSNYAKTDFIQVRSNTSYIMCSLTYNDVLINTTDMRIGYYDVNKKFINSSFTMDGIFTTTENTHFVKVCQCVQTDTIDVGLIKNWQLEEGTVATSYEPYFESTKTFYLNSPLLEGDKIVTKNGKVYHYHKMGMVVFDGSENWSKNNIETPDNFESFYNLNSDFNKLANGKLFTDTIKILTASEWNAQNVVGIYSGGKNSFGVLLNSTKPSVYFKANPTTVVYELASPYYELIDEYNNTILNIPNTVAHLTHTSAVPVNNTVFTNYKDELNVLESNTQYRVMFDCDKASIPFTVTLGGTSQTVTSKKGTHSLLITTPSTLVDKNLVIDGIGRCGIDNIRIFKGNAEYDYVKGLWSGYEERKLENLMRYSERTYQTTGRWNEINRSIVDIKPSIVYTLIYECNYRFDAKALPEDKILVQNCVGKGCCKFSTKLLNQHLRIVSLDFDQLYTYKMVLLEGDWTDNPPTYEEVMANEGKYAVKVKLDNPNATIFGKGGRL